jgi:prephenate dehydrogenase
MRTIDTGGIAAPQVVAVVGLGLIGASLCRALRETLPEMGIVGITRSSETAERAMDDGICDLAGTTPDLLRHVELAVLCTPVVDMPAWLDHSAGYPELMVTDCGSTKQWIVEQAQRQFDAERFLGGHPMAGRERSGYDAADATLFDGCTWVFTPTDPGQLDRFKPWVDCVTALHASVDVLDAAQHDQAVAWISHLPFALSAALMRTAATTPAWDTARRLASSGFRDMARLAGGDPAMYAAIAETNTTALLDAIAALIKELERMAKTVRRPEAAEAYFATARQLRAAWLAEREEVGRPVP